MSRKKIKHGWVLWNVEDRSFVDENWDADDVPLEHAEVYTTRAKARRYKIGSDRVRKVEVDSNGIPIRIIKGG